MVSFKDDLRGTVGCVPVYVAGVALRPTAKPDYAHHKLSICRWSRAPLGLDGRVVLVCSLAEPLSCRLRQLVVIRNTSLIVSARLVGEGVSALPLHTPGLHIRGAYRPAQLLRKWLEEIQMHVMNRTLPCFVYGNTWRALQGRSLSRKKLHGRVMRHRKTSRVSSETLQVMRHGSTVGELHFLDRLQTSACCAPDANKFPRKYRRNIARIPPLNISEVMYGRKAVSFARLTMASGAVTSRRVPRGEAACSRLLSGASSPSRAREIQLFLFKIDASALRTVFTIERRVRRSPPATSDICVFTIERCSDAGRQRRRPCCHLIDGGEGVSGVILVALNIEVLRAGKGEVRRVWSSRGMQGRRKSEIPEKTRRPATPPGTEPGSPGLEASSLTTTLPWREGWTVGQDTGLDRVRIQFRRQSHSPLYRYLWSTVDFRLAGYCRCRFAYQALMAVRGSRFPTGGPLRLYRPTVPTQKFPHTPSRAEGAVEVEYHNIIATVISDILSSKTGSGARPDTLIETYVKLSRVVCLYLCACSTPVISDITYVVGKKSQHRAECRLAGCILRVGGLLSARAFKGNPSTHIGCIIRPYASELEDSFVYNVPVDDGGKSDNRSLMHSPIAAASVADEISERTVEANTCWSSDSDFEHWPSSRLYTLTDRLHHRGSKLDPRSDLRSTQKTVAQFEFRAGLEIEIKFISNRRNWRFEISIGDQQPSDFRQLVLARITSRLVRHAASDARYSITASWGREQFACSFIVSLDFKHFYVHITVATEQFYRAQPGANSEYKWSLTEASNNEHIAVVWSLAKVLLPSYSSTSCNQTGWIAHGAWFMPTKKFAFYVSQLLTEVKDDVCSRVWDLVIEGGDGKGCRTSRVHPLRRKETNIEDTQYVLTKAVHDQNSARRGDGTLSACGSVVLITPALLSFKHESPSKSDDRLKADLLPVFRLSTVIHNLSKRNAEQHVIKNGFLGTIIFPGREENAPLFEVELSHLLLIELSRRRVVIIPEDGGGCLASAVFCCSRRRSFRPRELVCRVIRLAHGAVALQSLDLFAALIDDFRVWRRGRNIQVVEPQQGFRKVTDYKGYSTEVGDKTRFLMAEFSIVKIPHAWRVAVPKNMDVELERGFRKVGSNNDWGMSAREEVWGAYPAGSRLWCYLATRDGIQAAADDKSRRGELCSAPGKDNGYQFPPPPPPPPTTTTITPPPPNHQPLRDVSAAVSRCSELVSSPTHLPPLHSSEDAPGTQNCCTIRVQSWTGDRDEVHFEPPKLAVRNLDPRSAAIINLDPGSELESFDLGSGKMLVQRGNTITAQRAACFTLSALTIRKREKENLWQIILLTKKTPYTASTGFLLCTAPAINTLHMQHPRHRDLLVEYCLWDLYLRVCAYISKEVARVSSRNVKARLFSKAPMRVIEVSMEQRQNERAGETGDPRENPPTNGIVQHDSHLLQAPNSGLFITIGYCLLEKAFSNLTGPLRIRQNQHGSYVIRVQTVNTCRKVIQPIKLDSSTACLTDCDPIETESQMYLHEIAKFPGGGNTTHWRPAELGRVVGIRAPAHSLFEFYSPGSLPPRLALPRRAAAKHSLERRMNKAMRPMEMLILHKAEEYTMCIKVDVKQGFPKRSVDSESDEWHAKMQLDGFISVCVLRQTDSVQSVAKYYIISGGVIVPNTASQGGELRWRFVEMFNKLLCVRKLSWRRKLRVESALFVPVTRSQREYIDFPYSVFTDLTPFFVITDCLSVDFKSAHFIVNRFYIQDDENTARQFRVLHLAAMGHSMSVAVSRLHHAYANREVNAWVWRTCGLLLLSENSPARGPSAVAPVEFQLCNSLHIEVRRVVYPLAARFVARLLPVLADLLLGSLVPRRSSSREVLCSNPRQGITPPFTNSKPQIRCSAQKQNMVFSIDEKLFWHCANITNKTVMGKTPACETERRGGDKDDFATLIKCAISITRMSLNLAYSVVVVVLCVYLWSDPIISPEESVYRLFTVKLAVLLNATQLTNYSPAAVVKVFAFAIQPRQSKHSPASPREKC
ncbi:hypothetical protein PR048_027698 [Dryococelus australis]|uniref:Uncharacterized protein n=1 Tax=Dryococelus australis TaxID=614101 RepID=A0ABQ9GH75_9NEOP|nr:hypothetical protein PR048_027698 [Dryococelus australis]